MKTNLHIRSYDDLVRSQEQMEAVLKAQKEQLFTDFRELKQEFTPTVSALKGLGKFAVRSGTTSLLTTGINTIIDTVVKKVVLAKAGWFTKFIVPVILKNYSSHYVADHKDEVVEKIRRTKDNILDKIIDWISPKNSNGTPTDTLVVSVEQNDSELKS